MTPRKPGRPRLYAAPSAKVQLRIPAALYDRAYTVSARQRISLATLVRRAVERYVSGAA